MSMLATDAMPLFLEGRHVEHYWQLVHATLRELFGGSDAEVEQLRLDIANSPLEEQVLVYHTDPLSVARALSDDPSRPLEDWHYDTYARLREQSAFAEREIPVGAYTLQYR